MKQMTRQTATFRLQHLGMKHGSASHGLKSTYKLAQALRDYKEQLMKLVPEPVIDAYLDRLQFELGRYEMEVHELSNKMLKINRMTDSWK